jgi:hypothetical protein
MAAQAHQRVAFTTIGDALKSDDLPTYKVVIAVIEGCGGGPGDQQAYATAWRQLNTGQLVQPAAKAADSPATADLVLPGS